MNEIQIYIYTIFITYKYALCHFQTLQILTTLVTIYRC
jgi:hypothetical protein